MNRKKTLLALGIVLLSLTAGIIGVTLAEKHVDKVNTIDEEVFAINPDNVTEITVDYNNKLSFVKKDDEWKDADDESFPIDQAYMDELLSNFESVHASFIIDDVEDYSQYGLKTPTATVTIKENDDSKKMTFGTFSTMDSKRYICVDDKSVYLIDNDILEDISSERDDYMANKEVPEFSQITKVEATGAAEFTAVYEPDANYTYTDKYDYYMEENGEYKALDEDLIKQYVDNITNMDTSDYVTYSANAEDIKNYGFESPDLTIAISGEVSEDDEDETKNVSISFTSMDDEKYYARVGESTIIYNISADVYEALAKGSYYTLRPSEIIAAEFKDVLSVVCKTDDERYTVTVDASESGDDGLKYTVDGSEIDFQTAADKIKSLSLVEAGKDYTVGDEELQIKINLNNEAGTTLDLILYRYDGDNCVAKLNGETIGLVSRDAMSNLRESIISAQLNIGKTENEEN